MTSKCELARAYDAAQPSAGRSRFGLELTRHSRHFVHQPAVRGCVNGAPAVPKLPVSNAPRSAAPGPVHAADGPSANSATDQEIVDLLSEAANAVRGAGQNETN